MLEKFKTTIADEILSGNWEELKKSISQLSWHNRRREVEKTSIDFYILFSDIIEEIKQDTEKKDYNTIKQEFTKTADIYWKYFDKFEDQNFKTAQEIFLLLNEYIDKYILEQKNRLKKILFKNPGIENRFPVIEKMIEDHKTIASEEPKQQVKEVETIQEDKESLFISEINKIIVSDIELETKKSQIEEIFFSIFEMKNRSRKKFYRTLWLPEEYIKLIKDIDFDIIKILIQLKTEKINTNVLNEQLHKEIKKYMKSDIQPIASNWPIVIWKIKLPNDPRWEKKRKNVFHSDEGMQQETTDPLSLVWKSMGFREFITAFSLDYDDIEDHIKTSISVPVRYSNTTTDKKKNKLHFFNIWIEKKWINDVNINVSILDNENKFEEWKIYEVILTDITENKKAIDDPRKQTFFVKWKLPEDFAKFNTPAKQSLWDNPTLIKLSEAEQKN